MARLDHASLGKSLDPMVKPCQTLAQNPFWTLFPFSNLATTLTRDSLILPRLRHLSPNPTLPAAWTMARLVKNKHQQASPPLYYYYSLTLTLAVLLLLSYSYSCCPTSTLLLLLLLSY